MALDKDKVRMYVEFYVTLNDIIFNELYNDTLGDYNQIKEKYNIIGDNNYLMALLMLKRMRNVLKVRNAKMSSKMSELLYENLNDEIKRVLLKYTTPIVTYIPK